MVYRQYHVCFQALAFLPTPARRREPTGCIRSKRSRCFPGPTMPTVLQIVRSCHQPHLVCGDNNGLRGLTRTSARLDRLPESIAYRWPAIVALRNTSCKCLPQIISVTLVNHLQKREQHSRLSASTCCGASAGHVVWYCR